MGVAEKKLAVPFLPVKSNLGVVFNSTFSSLANLQDLHPKNV